MQKAAPPALARSRVEQAATAERAEKAVTPPEASRLLSH